MRQVSKFFAPVLLSGLLFFFMSCDSLGEPDLADAAAQINSGCPRMVDSETRLDAVTANGDQLNYHFSLVNVEAARVDTQMFRKAMRPGLLSLLRVSPEMEKLRRDEVTVRYFYTDKNNKHIIAFVFGPEDYK